MATGSNTGWYVSDDSETCVSERVTVLREEFEKKYGNRFTTRLDEHFAKRNIRGIKDCIREAEKEVPLEANPIFRMQFYYDIALAYADIRTLEPSDSHLEKEILNYRKAIDIYEMEIALIEEEATVQEDYSLAQWIAMRCYCNLGNTLCETNRYIAAIDSYFAAICISDTFSMASLNLSAALFQFSIFQITPEAEQYFTHAAYHYFKLAEQYQANLEEPGGLVGLDCVRQHWVKRAIDKYGVRFLNEELQGFGERDYSEKEYDYRSWLSGLRLFLNVESEIFRSPDFWGDYITLPDNADSTFYHEYTGLFNQIKQEYITARYLWYISSELQKPEEGCYLDKERNLKGITSNDVFGIRESLLRQSLKMAASTFDRIGFFLNWYFSVGLRGDKIGFKQIWWDIIRRGKSNIPNPMKEYRANNPFLEALFWLQKDFVEDNEVSLTSDAANRIVKMRNNMEHNCLRTVKRMPEKDSRIKFTVYTTEEQIEQNVFNTLKLLREAILYLVLAVNIKIVQNQENGSSPQTLKF